jgi:hypothetical protein
VARLYSSWNNDNGTRPPIFVDYRDHERSTPDCEMLTHDVWRVMVAVQPAVVLTYTRPVSLVTRITQLYPA